MRLSRFNAAGEEEPGDTGTVNKPIEAASTVGTREELIAYLEDLAEKSRQGSTPVENPVTSDFIEASVAWLEGLDSFLRHHTGEGAPNSPSSATISMTFSAGLVYE